jgi:hypothetical protein
MAMATCRLPNSELRVADASHVIREASAADAALVNTSWAEDFKTCMKTSTALATGSSARLCTKDHYERRDAKLDIRGAAMSRRSMLTIWIATLWLAVLGGLAISAQDKYTVKVPGGLTFSEFGDTKDGRPFPSVGTQAWSP